MSIHPQPKKRPWPREPEDVCALAQELLPGWGVGYRPAGGVSGRTVYSARRGNLLIEASEPWQVLRYVAELADEEVPVWATRP